MRGLRWSMLGAALLLASVPGWALPQQAPATAGEPADPLARAQATLAATRRWFGANDGTTLYREHYPARRGEGRYSTEWPFSQVHVGVLDLAAAGPAPARGAVATLDAHRAAQMLYWANQTRNGHPGFASEVAPPRGKGGDLFYDDNEWVGLALMQHWLFFKDVGSLALAEKVFALVSAAWDTDPHHPAPGGLFWTQASWNSDRNTVSNMPAAELALRLFEATGNRSYLTDALRYYAWTNRYLQRPDGLYMDHIDLQGRIDAHVRSYNQGVPIGVNVLLYKATSDRKYLAEAQRIADASYAWFITGDRVDREVVPFNAIWFKNLLLLESVTGGTRFRDAMRDYAERMWTGHRDPATGLFVWPGRRRPDLQLIDQGAMIQINAVLAWNPADDARLY